MNQKLDQEKMCPTRIYLGTYSGAISGVIAGAEIDAGIGLATGGWAMPATVPLGIVGGLLCGIAGRKIGSELDRKDWDH